MLNRFGPGASVQDAVQSPDGNSDGSSRSDEGNRDEGIRGSGRTTFVWSDDCFSYYNPPLLVNTVSQLLDDFRAASKGQKRVVVRQAIEAYRVAGGKVVRAVNRGGSWFYAVDNRDIYSKVRNIFDNDGRESNKDLFNFLLPEDIQTTTFQEEDDVLAGKLIHGLDHRADRNALRTILGNSPELQPGIEAFEEEGRFLNVYYGSEQIYFEEIQDEAHKKKIASSQASDLTRTRDRSSPSSD